MDYLKSARKSWEEVYENALDPECVQKYKNRKQAVDLYIDGCQVSRIQEITGIIENKIPALIRKCLTCDEYNHQRGYTALIPYTRLGRPRKSESAKSFSGSFQSLLLHYPVLKEYITTIYFEKRMFLLRNLSIKRMPSKCF